MLRVPPIVWISVAASLLVACGGDGSVTSASEGEDGSSSGGPATTAATTSSDSVEPTSESLDTTSGQTWGSSSTSTEDPSTSVADSGSSEGSSSTGTTAACERSTVLGEDFSYLWVANSPQGTISKINTETLVEEGRFLSRLEPNGSPSRTSVNLNGDVAVANRSGGITLFHARLEDCSDPNNTSSGPDDVKAWPDGCMGWHTPFDYSTQRPVAWTAGEFSQESCRYENAMLWTAGAQTTSSNIEILLLDGDTGTVEATIPTTQPAATFGMYGGAVDAEGNFWGSMLAGQVLFRVTLDDLTLDQWDAPSGYGITVDGQGRPWTCQNQLARFNTTTEQWDISPAEVVASGGGCAVDANNTLWVAGASSRLLGVDVDSFAIVHDLPIPGYAKGVSIDFAGNVWAVSLGADAWRVDPQDGSVETFTGLDQPYSYSDMTGFALALQAGR